MLTSFEYRTVDFMVRRALAEIVKQNGPFEFSVTVTREIDRKCVSHFITEYLPSAGANEHIISTLTEVFIKSEPKRYLDVHSADLLGANVGAKATRAVLKFLKRNGFKPDNREYTLFTDAISPISRNITYKVELGEYEYGDDYDLIKFSRDGKYEVGTTSAKSFDVTRGVTQTYPTPAEFAERILDWQSGKKAR